MPTLDKVEFIYGLSIPRSNGPCPVTRSQARRLLDRGLIEWGITPPLPGFEGVEATRHLYWTKSGDRYVTQAINSMLSGGTLPIVLRQWLTP